MSLVPVYYIPTANLFSEMLYKKIMVKSILLTKEAKVVEAIPNKPYQFHLFKLKYTLLLLTCLMKNTMSLSSCCSSTFSMFVTLSHFMSKGYKSSQHPSAIIECRISSKNTSTLVIRNEKKNKNQPIKRMTCKLRF